jgi:RimJ/RimL family protein N-acetyltransferase
MITFRKPAAMARLNGPMIETKRLILRTWRESDIAANTAMLADPESGRYITADHRPVTDELNGWRNAAIMSGHWALHGYGMFVVEEKSSGKYVGRVGPWHPPTWPGFEVGWGIAKEFRGKGYAIEATCASIDWVFENLAVDRIVHTIKPDNIASQSVAQRLGAVIEGQAEVFGDTVDVWVTRRERWRRPPQAAPA